MVVNEEPLGFWTVCWTKRSRFIDNEKIFLVAALRCFPTQQKSRVVPTDTAWLSPHIAVAVGTKSPDKGWIFLFLSCLGWEALSGCGDTYKPPCKCCWVFLLWTIRPPLFDCVWQDGRLWLLFCCGVEVSTDHQLTVSRIRWRGMLLERRGKPKHAVRVTSECLAVSTWSSAFTSSS